MIRVSLDFFFTRLIYSDLLVISDYSYIIFILRFILFMHQTYTFFCKIHGITLKPVTKPKPNQTKIHMVFYMISIFTKLKTRHKL